MQFTTLGRTGLRVGIAGLGCGGFSRLGGQPCAPAQGPNVVRRRVSEKTAHGMITFGTGRRRAQAAECQGEIGLPFGHGVQQRLGQFGIAIALG